VAQAADLKAVGFATGLHASQGGLGISGPGTFSQSSVELPFMSSNLPSSPATSLLDRAPEYDTALSQELGLAASWKDWEYYIQRALDRKTALYQNIEFALGDVAGIVPTPEYSSRAQCVLGAFIWVNSHLDSVRPGPTWQRMWRTIAEVQFGNVHKNGGVTLNAADVATKHFRVWLSNMAPGAVCYDFDSVSTVFCRATHKDVLFDHITIRATPNRMFLFVVHGKNGGHVVPGMLMLAPDDDCSSVVSSKGKGRVDDSLVAAFNLFTAPSDSDEGTTADATSSDISAILASVNTVAPLAKTFSECGDFCGVYTYEQVRVLRRASRAAFQAHRSLFNECYLGYKSDLAVLKRDFLADIYSVEIKSRLVREPTLNTDWEVVTDSVGRDYAVPSFAISEMRLYFSGHPPVAKNIQVARERLWSRFQSLRTDEGARMDITGDSAAFDRIDAVLYHVLTEHVDVDEARRFLAELGPTGFGCMDAVRTWIMRCSWMPNSWRRRCAVSIARKDLVPATGNAGPVSRHPLTANLLKRVIADVPIPPPSVISPVVDVPISQGPECVKAGASKPLSKKCFSCGQFGHLKAKCSVRNAVPLGGSEDVAHSHGGARCTHKRCKDPTLQCARCGAPIEGACWNCNSNCSCAQTLLQLRTSRPCFLLQPPFRVILPSFQRPKIDFKVYEAELRRNGKIKEDCKILWGQKASDRFKLRGPVAVGPTSMERFPVSSDCSVESTKFALLSRQLKAMPAPEEGRWSVPADFLVIKYSHMSKSTHLSTYEGKRRKKMEYAYIEAEAEYWCHPFYLFVFWSAFTKHELLPKADINGVNADPRLICCQPPLLNIYTSCHVQSGYKANCVAFSVATAAYKLGIPGFEDDWHFDFRVVSEVLPQFQWDATAKCDLLTSLVLLSPAPIVYGSGLNPKEIGALWELFCVLEGQGYTIWVSDYERYDSTIGIPAFRAYRRLSQACCPDHMFEAIHKIHERATISLIDGTKVKVVGTMKSGATYTTKQNTDLNLLATFHSLAAASELPLDEIFSLVCVAAAGDDLLFATAPKLTKRLSVSSLRLQYSRFGFSAKVERTDLVKATFLATQYWPGRRAAPELARWAYKFGWSLTRQPDYAKWLQNCYRGAFCNLKAVPFLSEALQLHCNGSYHYTTDHYTFTARIGDFSSYTFDEYSRAVALLYARYPLLRAYTQKHWNEAFSPGMDNNSLLSDLLRDGGYGAEHSP